jgi:hypothetical protein
MKALLVVLFALAPAAGLPAQSIPAPGEITEATANTPPPADDSSSSPPTAAPTLHNGHGSSAAAELAMEHLTRSNQELLDLLKKQQAVLEDIQYDRRLQERQITLLEQRLEDTLQLNASLQTQVARLQAAANTARSAPESPDQTSAAPGSAHPTADASAIQQPPIPPAPPASTLPPEQAAGAPGTMWWHRLLSLSGTDSENSTMFHISGKQWRVVWHNQDRPGAAYKNTSALFLSAFPKNDTLPKKVCSQLGTGGDARELTGTGDYYLKIEASGGKWELAVEEFR